MHAEAGALVPGYDTAGRAQRVRFLCRPADSPLAGVFPPPRGRATTDRQVRGVPREHSNKPAAMNRGVAH